MDQLTLSCPACAQPVSEEDQYCEQCGTDLRAAREHRPGYAPSTQGAAPVPVPGQPGTGGPAAPPGAGAVPPGGARPAAPADAAVPGQTRPGPQGAAARPGDPRTARLNGSPAASPASAPAAPGGDSGTTGDFLIAAPAHVLVEEDLEEGPDPRVCAACGARRIDPDGYCETCGRPQPRPRDHQERALASIAGVSDRGHRHHRNEDAFAVAATRRPDGSPAVVAVVCDGVSSATRPDEASETAAETASEHLLEALESGAEPEDAMREAIVAAANAVVELSAQGPPEPGHNAPACTCVSAVAADGRCTIGWVGDSRAYWIPDADRATAAQRLTVDDSWAARMVEAGLMGEAEAFADPRAHAITGWLGADAVELVPHTRAFVPPAAGVLLVCTDGLWNYAEAAADLADVVPPDARLRPLEAAQSLVRFALENGGHDNVTVAVLPWLPPVAPASPGHPPTEVELTVPPTLRDPASPAPRPLSLAEPPSPPQPAPTPPTPQAPTARQER